MTMLIYSKIEFQVQFCDKIENIPMLERYIKKFLWLFSYIRNILKKWS